MRQGFLKNTTRPGGGTFHTETMGGFVRSWLNNLDLQEFTSLELTDWSSENSLSLANQITSLTKHSQAGMFVLSWMLERVSARFPLFLWLD